MHSSGWIYRIVVCANSGSSLRGWMQSTGQTSTQAVSFVSMQGSVMMNGIRGFSVRGVSSAGHAIVRARPASGKRDPIQNRAVSLVPVDRDEHHRASHLLVSQVVVQRPAL